jgi:hypothetical protein
MRRRMVPAEGYTIEPASLAQRAEGERSPSGADSPSIRNETTGVAVPVNGITQVFEKGHEVTTRIVAAGEIEQVWKREGSHGTTRWRLAPDGDHMVISQRVHDSHFEAPIEYSTTYRRAP